MRTIDITKIASIYINLDEQVNRRRSTENLLKSNNINAIRFPGIKHERGIVGCGMSHSAILADILPDTLILEDDIGTTEWYNKQIDVPSDIDALYLGVSGHGYVEGYRDGIGGVVKTTKYSESLIQIYNMCSAHAIVYCSKRYIDAAYKMSLYCLEHNIAWDLGIASIHKHFNILTPLAPWFYQTEQEPQTNFKLKVSNVNRKLI